MRLELLPLLLKLQKQQLELITIHQPKQQLKQLQQLTVEQVKPEQLLEPEVESKSRY